MGSKPAQGLPNLFFLERVLVVAARTERRETVEHAQEAAEGRRKPRARKNRKCRCE